MHVLLVLFHKCMQNLFWEESQFYHVQKVIAMEKDSVEFKMLDAKLVGNDTVVFKLEDGATVKVKVGMGRAGVATTFKNPDGTPHYNIHPSIQIIITPSSKKYYIPKSKIKTPTPPRESTFKPV